MRDDFLGDGRRLRERDERLAAAIAEAERLILWFEADLYDPLLLVQILERLHPGAPSRMVLVGQERWESVTEVEPARLGALGRDAPTVTEEELELASSAWAAFTAETPLEMERLAAGTPTLPAVGEALGRLLDGLAVDDRGRSVLAGKERWEAEMERWLGGTRIPPGRSPWEWDPGARRVQQRH